MSFDALLTAVPFLLLLLITLPYLVQVLTGGAAPTPDKLLEPFWPPHQPVQGTDPFEVFAQRVRGITAYRGQISLYAIPLFAWFSTRLFAGMRTALNHIFDISGRPSSFRGGAIQWYLWGKFRDVALVVVTLGLFVANTAFTAWLGVLEARSHLAVPELHFFVTTVGRILGLLLAFGFSLSLFFVIYKFASSRPLGWRPALVAASFAAVAFELAKQGFGWYMSNAVGPARLSLGFNVGAIILFVLWVWYTALVFLLGGVVAETWKLRELQRRQRAILA